MTKRKHWDMPKDVWNAVLDNKLEDQYAARPPYQQNDYIGWIEQAKRPETREKRLNQMIYELKAGDAYMGMAWGKDAPKKKPTDKPKTVEEYIQSSGELFADVIASLDVCLRSTHPDYTSKAAWGGWAYLLDKNYSCLIVRYKSHVKLMIMRGLMLKDPKKKLQGSGSNTQHLRFETVDDVDCEYLKDLLTQQKKLFDSGVKWEG